MEALASPGRSRGEGDRRDPSYVVSRRIIAGELGLAVRRWTQPGELAAHEHGRNELRHHVSMVL
eukprot:10795677-Alexandrium_andersonii.AAC.1